MSSASGLLPNSYEGIVDGIEVKWGPNAIKNLPQNAASLGQDPIAMKEVTESMSVACAKRLGKTTIRILGSFHNHTTVTKTGQRFSDPWHCSISLNPGGTKVHIYVTPLEGLPIEHMKVIGESVVLKNQDKPDPALSIGSYPH